MRSAPLVSRRGNALSLGRRSAAAVAIAVATGLALIPLTLLSAPGTAHASGVPAPNLTWSTLSPPASPAPLAYTGAAYDSDNGTVVMFGGVTAPGELSNTTWVWNGSTWHGYTGSQIVAPQARELAAMAFDPVLHQLLLFGGRGYGGEILGDTWAWNGASWYQVDQRLSGASPSAREGAAIAYDGHGNLVMFGGDGPSPGTGRGSGRTAPVSLGDTWLWTSAGWVPSPATGPAARTSASMAYDSNSGLVVMFGGSSSAIASGSPGYLGDTWGWNGSAWSAVQVPPASVGAVGPGTAPAAPLPSSRFGAAAADDPTAGGVVLFGGAGPAGVLSDTWIWNGRAWSQAPATGNPDARAGAGCAYDVAAGQLVMFGGAVAPTGQSGGSGISYGATIGAAGPVLGSTSVLTAGGPVSLGGSPGSLPGIAAGPAATSLPPGTAPESASPGPPGSATAGTESAGPGARSTASAPAVLRRGGLVTLRGTGFAPRTKVTVTFHSTPEVVGTTTSGAAGDFVITVAVPQSASAGTHRFFASGEGPKGPLQLLIATVTVLGSGGAAAGTTTAERAALVGLALGVPLTAWLAMDAFGRRRRKAYRISSERQDS